MRKNAFVETLGSRGERRRNRHRKSRKACCPLVPVKKKAQQRTSGSAKGKVHLSRDFLKPLPEAILAEFEKGESFWTRMSFCGGLPTTRKFRRLLMTDTKWKQRSLPQCGQRLGDAYQSTDRQIEISHEAVGFCPEAACRTRLRTSRSSWAMPCMSSLYLAITKTLLTA